MQTSINNSDLSCKTLLNRISVHKVLPANQVDKNNLLIRPVSGGTHTSIKDSLEPTSLNNSFNSLEQSPTRKAYIKTLKDRIFSPGDDLSSAKANNKNQTAISELSKILLNSPLLTKPTEPQLLTKSVATTAPKYLPDKSYYHLNRKTLILDLDETLVHSNFKSFYGKSDIVLNIPFDQKSHTIHVLKRPFVDEFLDKMSRLYELVIFTASIPEYANPLLNKLDVNRRISLRLFREHCTASSNLFIKDLRKVGRNLKDTILLDNNPVSYALNKENGLPILTWHSNKNDTELVKIIPLLEHLAKAEDVREVIKRVVSNSFINWNEVNRLIYSKEEEKNNQQMMNNTVNYSISNGITSKFNFNSKTSNRFYFDKQEKMAQDKEVELFHDFFDSKKGSGNLLLDKKYQEKYDMFYETKDKSRKDNRVTQKGSNEVIMPSNSFCNYRDKEKQPKNNLRNTSTANQEESHSYLKVTSSSNDFLTSFSHNTNTTLTSFYKQSNQEAPSIPLNQNKLYQLSHYSSPKRERDKETSTNGASGSSSHLKINNNNLSKYAEKSKFDFSNQAPRKGTISTQEQLQSNTTSKNTSPFTQLINWDFNIHPLKSAFTKEETKTSPFAKNSLIQEKNRTFSQTLRERSNNDVIGKYQ